MQDHFLKEIEILNYKCFKNFKAKDFSRINLISGKNNVGKTAFMEALYINLHSQDISHLNFALDQVTFSRNNLEYIENTNLTHDMKSRIEKIDEIKTKTNQNIIEFKQINQEGKKEYFININNSEITINVNDYAYISTMATNILHIDNFGFTNDNLIYVYESIQRNDKESELNNLINSFDSDITGFKVIGNTPQCKVSNNQYREINEFGDGLKHYISIISSIYHCRNGQLFIDEIDNGIHYTHLKKLWEIIFSVSKEANCQIFATTHSKEMITAFAKVSEELEDNDISFIELGKNKSNEIKANIYDKEMFIYELKQNHEVRGW